MQAPLAGHEDVDDHEVRRVSLVRADPSIAVRGLPDLVPHVLQMLGQGLAERDVVVDDEDSGHVGLRERRRSESNRRIEVLQEGRDVPAFAGTAPVSSAASP